MSKIDIFKIYTLYLKKYKENIKKYKETILKKFKEILGGSIFFLILVNSL